MGLGPKSRITTSKESLFFLSKIARPRPQQTLARMAVPKLVLNGLYSCVDFTRPPVFRSKHTLQWSSKMPKTELKPFLTILGTRTRATPEYIRDILFIGVLYRTLGISEDTA